MFKFLSYIRAILLIPIIAVHTAIWSIFVVTARMLGASKEAVFYIVARIWADVLLWASGVKLEVRGRENFPQGGCLVLFNHTSHYDIMAMFSGTPRFCHFGAKAELFSVPFFGRAMTALGALRIERKNRAKVIQIYREAESRAAQGDVFALAPEGTRQPGHGFLGEFKSGPFFFAVNSKMPVVPLVIVGCELVLPKKSILPGWGRWRTQVVLEFLPPIYPEGDSEEQVPALKEKTRQVMASSLHSYWGNPSK